jgi:hypothetical protein
MSMLLAPSKEVDKLITDQAGDGAAAEVPVESDGAAPAED